MFLHLACNLATARQPLNTMIEAGTMTRSQAHELVCEQQDRVIARVISCKLARLGKAHAAWL